MKTKTTRARIPAIQNPFDRALKYLSLRSRSVKEVSDYLLKKGYSLEDANNAIQKLLELKFLNDDNFARSFTEQKQKKGKSRMAIEFELKLKGINKEISQDVLNYSKSDFKLA